MGKSTIIYLPKLIKVPEATTASMTPSIYSPYDLRILKKTKALHVKAKTKKNISKAKLTAPDGVLRKI